ncbi:MAG: N-succinylarginine dihydrolase [Mariniblastus sp.]|nr:N-succinylarginine dihydrolase [Mariniblastus sp.]MDG2183706.1 N-succinylarginine dihydrolase [Mariniblastus sp.]
MSNQEYFFDGLIGPTHNYAGLSFGNIASKLHGHEVANPKAAALQGLAKMKRVADLTGRQCLLPPLRRPRLEFLRSLGFKGSNAEVIDQAYRCRPELLAICYSASSMWTANAATVSPSADCGDGRLHFTPANLQSTLHRSMEAKSTARNLRAIFNSEELFCVHPPLPAQGLFADEGAANHTRFVGAGQSVGLEFFVFGMPSGSPGAVPRKFPARQTQLASEAVARRHQLQSDRVCFGQQNPEVIDAGVFHNDVIAVGHEDVLLCHSQAFLNQPELLNRLSLQFENLSGSSLRVIEFSESELPLQDAVSSYLFNSQLVTRKDGGITLICPVECEENRAAKECIAKVVEGRNRIDDVVFLDLRQSMNNGGGPACLRLRVVLDARQQEAMHAGVILTESLYGKLTEWVGRHYRESLSQEDLRDPGLVGETWEAMEELSKILDLPSQVLLNQP